MREVVYVKSDKPEIVSMIRIDGVWRRQEEVPEEELQKLVEKKLDDVMRSIGFERISAK